MAGRVNCAQFQAALGDYLGRALEATRRASLAEHALSCKACRRLLDDVKSKLEGADLRLEASRELEAALEKIPDALTELDCADFQELISDFLDGFVPASTYHRFVAHSARCQNCSDLLTEVVYAVAACHLVHVYEELEVPKPLMQRLNRIASQRKGSPTARAAILVALLLVGALRSGFHTAMTGLYTAARIKAVKLYSRGAELYYRMGRGQNQGPSAANQDAIFGNR